MEARREDAENPCVVRSDCIKLVVRTYALAEKNKGFVLRGLDGSDEPAQPSNRVAQSRLVLTEEPPVPPPSVTVILISFWLNQVMDALPKLRVRCTGLSFTHTEKINYPSVFPAL